jgi:hypothetical protein
MATNSPTNLTFPSARIADEHGPGRPWRHLYRSNPCVCHPASDKGNILHPRKLDIGNEIAAAVEMAVVLFSRKPGADSIIRHKVRPHASGAVSCTVWRWSLTWLSTLSGH